MVTAATLPAEYVGYGKYSGVDSIVGAPSDASVAYMSMGAQPYTASAGQVFRSSNRGDTWDKIVDYPLGIFDSIDAQDGDKDIFGQLYAGFTSAGFAYGRPAVPGK